MKLSVIVPSYDCETLIETCLRAVRRSGWKEYELIAVDDASRDRTAELAEPLADRLVRQSSNLGCSRARNAGAAIATGEILVFVDSDVAIRPDTLEKIARYFDAHPEVDALTGRLAVGHPHSGFFSQYKNLYMHYIFGLLPERVGFLYGSVHAIRASLRSAYDPLVFIANDTELGQRLVAEGKTLAFLKDLEVVHLKHYGFMSLLRNDFRVPFAWTDFFLRHRGYRQLWKNEAGYLHSPREQILSLAAAPAALCATLAASAGVPGASVAAWAALAAWGWLNARFFYFLGRQRGALFAASSVGFTFLDHLVMTAAVAWGFAVHGSRREV